MCGYRWRNLYYLTGQPGWVRFGYSPGWIGRSPTGLPPCVQYPRFTTWLQEQQPPAAPAGIPTLPREQEIAALESQTQLLGDRLERIKKRLEELRH
jgi:hypothetical protein